MGVCVADSAGPAARKLYENSAKALAGNRQFISTVEGSVQ